MDSRTEFSIGQVCVKTLTYGRQGLWDFRVLCPMGAFCGQTLMRVIP
jgi:hypothetical protein